MIAGPVMVSTPQGQYKVHLDTWPEACPICGKAYDPTYVGSTLRHDRQVLFAAYTCPRETCMGWAIGVYMLHPNELRGRGELTYVLVDTYPVHVTKHEWPEVISTLSPDFVAIYHDAYASEQYHLDLISGPGYGKALEFLVKDYAIHRYPNDAEEIKKKFLGPCIESYIDDPRAKKMAKRAAWLRNDFTHYYQKWTDKDLSDLKTLMTLVVNWIGSQLLIDQYEQSMPDSAGGP